jgi:3-phenylpropionate/cinnamic acid dioxygenase small subunit
MTMLRVVPSGSHSTRRRRASEIVSLFREDAAAVTPERLSLEDRIELEELISEYALAIDHARWNELPSLFAHDAVLKVGRDELAGRVAIAEWSASCAARKPRRTRHQVTNVIIRPLGQSRATATATVVVHVAKEGRRDTFVETVSELRAEFVRVGGTWRFGRHAVVHIADA